MSRRAAGPATRTDPARTRSSAATCSPSSSTWSWSAARSRPPRRIVYGAIERIAEQTGRPADAGARSCCRQALDNVKPAVEVKSRRVGGATYQVPVEVRASRRQTLAMRWVIEAARARSEKSMAHAARRTSCWTPSENRGAAVRKREDTHRMAEANKAFAHYRW